MHRRRRRDATVELSRVGGVYWALGDHFAKFRSFSYKTNYLSSKLATLHAWCHTFSLTYFNGYRPPMYALCCP